MRRIADTLEELERLYEETVRPDMTFGQRDGLWNSLEEEATDFYHIRHKPVFHPEPTTNSRPLKGKRK